MSKVGSMIWDCLMLKSLNVDVKQRQIFMSKFYYCDGGAIIGTPGQRVTPLARTDAGWCRLADSRPHRLRTTGKDEFEVNNFRYL